MSGKRKYVISFGSLGTGKHEYEYHLNDLFFEKLTYSEIKKADVRIDVRLNKQTSLLIFDFVVRGQVTVPCDRCSMDTSIKIKGEYQLLVRLGGVEATEENGDTLVLPGNELEMDIEHYLYEYTILSLPVKRVHPKVSDCDRETIKKLKEIEASGKEHKTDPRWDLLKNLKFNN